CTNGGVASSLDYW
nr:immunoglobulin heavy chain junction region [Macaca mulatta]